MKRELILADVCIDTEVRGATESFRGDYAVSKMPVPAWESEEYTLLLDICYECDAEREEMIDEAIHSAFPYCDEFDIDELMTRRLAPLRWEFCEVADYARRATAGAEKVLKKYYGYEGK